MTETSISAGENNARGKENTGLTFAIILSLNVTELLWWSSFKKLGARAQNEFRRCFLEFGSLEFDLEFDGRVLEIGIQICTEGIFRTVNNQKKCNAHVIRLNLVQLDRSNFSYEAHRSGRSAIQIG